ncbi:hypothetical protein Acid345_1553 [Candidatus Koribacter versatilis Ellin345]|uniref:Uncharacterized protein n=1 Tax=Koribacter versatilis (strain Ellin345) TaxID=204669 RepID=Q1IRE5_KORVE|nr:hypothetical protein Acid345_1553 [Candidatus Koribacter versatilis Ellin345]
MPLSPAQNGKTSYAPPAPWFEAGQRKSADLPLRIADIPLRAADVPLRANIPLCIRAALQRCRTAAPDIFGASAPAAPSRTL